MPSTTALADVRCWANRHAALAVCAALNGGAMVAGGVLVSIHVMPKWLQVHTPALITPGALCPCRDS
jgi:hypothetical protein